MVAPNFFPPRICSRHQLTDKKVSPLLSSFIIREEYRDASVDCLTESRYFTKSYSLLLLVVILISTRSLVRSSNTEKRSLTRRPLPGFRSLQVCSSWGTDFLESLLYRDA